MDLPLASEFPPATRDAWSSLVARVLKGADVERALRSRSRDDLPIEPLYPKAADGGSVLRRPASSWRVAQRLDHPDPAIANALALADLEGGADRLTLTLAGCPIGRGFGLAIRQVDDLDRALDGVLLDLIEIEIESPPFAGEAAGGLVTELLARRDLAPADVTMHLGLDPAGDLARTGQMPLPWPDLATRFVAVAAQMRDYGGTAARVDTRPYHEAGASEAQEIAAALATGVAYVRALETGGFDVDEARRRIGFLLVADADILMSVAKLRAFRQLWAAVETSCGLEPAPVRLHVETAWRMMTRRDPWSNLLRGTLATFAAGIGGADSVAVLPFTAALGLPDAFARRLARNTSLVLLEESNLARVVDPVAGSGAFEALTAGLREAGWAAFQELEREGGMFAALQSGTLQARISAVRAEREAAVATRREPIIGASEFPDLNQAAVSVLSASPPAFRSAGPGLPSLRSAEPYEQLRDLSDDLLARTGARPRVFLANLGTLAAFSPRATFARNAFEAGGIEALTNDGFATAEAAAAAFQAAGTTVACLCSSDEIYAESAASAAAALKVAGAEMIFLAGRPGALEAELRAAGVTGFLHAGCDLPALLAKALRAD